MAKIFGIPILLAVILGSLLPYTAIELAPFSFVPLFLLMFLAGLSINWSQMKRVFNHWFALLCLGVLLYVVTPLLQLALAQLLLRDSIQIFGALFAAMTPTAIVAPYFVKLIDGDEELALFAMVLSHLLHPLTMPIIQALMPYAGVNFDVLPLFKYTALLVTLPLALAFLAVNYLPAIKQKISRSAAGLNMLCLALLIFPLFGSAAMRVNLHYVPMHSIALVLAIALFQDFGTFLLFRPLLPRFFADKEAKAILLCISMKNTAIAAAILLFHAPQAGLPAALTFIAHALIFNMVPFLRGRRAA